ncbi:MAG: TonB-dependent hemoglobin/transferrin/lactoferrin family receptor [Pacificimonas sp.]|nr:TonB-dependent hemoglobin/transferrin/lactoferrin family receptor [Pacificimonas sp.]
MTFRSLALASAAALSIAIPAFAQGAPTGDAVDQPVGIADDDITITATRQPRNALDVPTTVTVIDDEEIADILATDIRELVRFEPGVFVRQAPARFGAALGTTGRAGAADFNIRGIGGNRVLIQVDDIRVPDGFSFGAQDAGRGDYVDLGLVKSVEILRGPTSALYGSDGLAGAVSFQLADPSDLIEDGEPYAVRLRGTYSSGDNEFSESILAAGESGDFGAIIAYTRRDGSELETQGDVGGTGQTRTIANPQDTESNALLGRLVWNPDDRNRIRLTGDWQDSRVETDLLSEVSTVPNPFTGATTDELVADDSTERVRVSLDWRHQFEGETLDDLTLRAFWQSSENRQFAFEARTPLPDRERLNTFEIDVMGGSGELRARFETGPVIHRVVVGGDISKTVQSGLRDGTVPPVGEIFPFAAFPETDFVLGGLFIANELTFLDGALTLFPALRWDHYDLDPDNDPLLPTFVGVAQDGSRLSPKLGALAELGSGFSLYGNYAQGFRAPQPTQINQFFENLVFGYTSLPNPDLGPETSESFEGGVRYQSSILTAALTAFSANYDDFISQELVGGTFRPGDPGVFQFVNLDEVDISGLEARISLRLDSGFTGDLSMAYADGDVVTGDVDVPLTQVEPFTLVSGLGYRDPAGAFGVNLIGTFTARKSLDDIDPALCTGPCFRPDGTSVVDLTAFARLNETFTVRAGVFNLFDETYAFWSDVAGVPSDITETIGFGPMGPITQTVPNPELDAFTRPGRNISLSLTARF